MNMLIGTQLGNPSVLRKLTEVIELNNKNIFKRNRNSVQETPFEVTRMWLHTFRSKTKAPLLIFDQIFIFFLPPQSVILKPVGGTSGKEHHLTGCWGWALTDWLHSREPAPCLQLKPLQGPGMWTDVPLVTKRQITDKIESLGAPTEPGVFKQSEFN